MCNIKLLHSYSIGIFLINHWVLADVIANPRIIIPEPVIIQSSLLVLILIFKWNELSAAVKVADVTVDVIVCLPDDITIIIVCLYRTTDVVTDDAVMFVTNNLGCRDIAVTVVNPCDEVLNWFRPVECDLASLGNNRIRVVSLGIVPLVQDDITIP